MLGALYRMSGALSVVWTAGAVAACGTPGTPSFSPADDCVTRCEVKVRSCRAPEDGASICGELCDDLTSQQMACFEGLSCDTLSHSRSVDEVCPSASDLDGGLADACIGCDPFPSAIEVSAPLPPSESSRRHLNYWYGGGRPTIEPAGSPIPEFETIEVSIVRPDPGPCVATVVPDLSYERVGLELRSEDLSSTSCSDLINQIRHDGLTVVIRDASFANSPKSVTVTIDLVR
jgi:hypothetical protein